MKGKSVNRLRYILFQKKETLLSLLPIRFAWMGITLMRFYLYQVCNNNMYLALSALLRYERDVSCLVGEEKLGSLYTSISKRFMTKTIAEGQNLALNSYIQSLPAQQCRELFSGFGREHLIRMRYPKPHIIDTGRQGDLIILKPCLGPQEKGVLFVQYDEGVQRFAALYDVENLAKQYRFVVEPSTSGYQNAMFFLLQGIGTDVIIEAQYLPDYEYIKNIGGNFHPIRLGAGDWADPKLFIDGTDVQKKYDIVMIANWLSWKRHDLFFNSLAKIRTHIQKVAVIGYPIEGRTLADVQKECQQNGVEDLVDFFEKITSAQVGEILRQSKAGILLSKDEGANRGIYECFFSGVPIILTDENRGVNRDHITDEVGLIASDHELPDIIVKMIENYRKFSPRKWALRNTGFENSTRKLNEFVKQLAISSGERWTKDIFTKHNSPHARFAYEEEQVEADKAVYDLEPFLRISAPKKA